MLKSIGSNSISLVALFIFNIYTFFFSPSLLIAQSERDGVKAAMRSMERVSGAPIKATISPDTGLIIFVATAPDHPIPVTGPDGASPEQIAARFMAAYGMAFGIYDASQLRRTRLQGPDEVGMNHVRFQQLHNDLPVRGAELTIHLRGSNVVTAQAKTLPDLESLCTTPTVTLSAASDSARRLLAEKIGITDAVISTPSLEIFNMGLLDGSSTPSYLAWFVEANGPAIREFIWIDANTGDILRHFNVLAEVALSQIYDYTNPSNPILVTQFPSGDVSADRAYDYAIDTYNYFFNSHGRDSWDGAGAPIIINVHYPYCSGETAHWSIDHVSYCKDQIVTDDVIGHEITHGISQAAANMQSFPNESGALNEGYAYIFGETVDLTNGRDAGPNLRWGWAEDIVGAPLVDMMNPAVSGKAGKVSDPQIVCGHGNDPAHENAWVLAHAYALMIDGGSFNGFTISGIGLEKSAKIHYRALTNYLQTSSNFLDNYYALKQSCQDLIGVGGMTYDDCAEATKALDAVEMSIPLCPEFLLTANGQHSIDIRLSRGDGTFFPPVSIGEDPGVNYVEFAIDTSFTGNNFFAATDESPSRLYQFTRRGRALFSRTFIKTLDVDPKERATGVPDYGLGLTAGFHPGIQVPFLLENINIAFPLSSGATGYWIAKGNLCLSDTCDRVASQTRDTYNFAEIFTGWTLGKSSNMADVDGDGFADMLAGEQSSGGNVSSRVYLLRGGRDTGQIPYRYFWGQPLHVFTTDRHPATHITLGDFNNDGKVDAIIGQDDDGDPGAAYLYFGHGDGTFEQLGRKVFDVQPLINLGNDQPGAGNFQAYDADGDGILDIISAYKKKAVDDPDERSRLVFIKGRGNGYFNAPVAIEDNLLYRTAFAVPMTSQKALFVLQGADLNHDGCADLTDLEVILKDIRGGAPHDPYFDLNGDGATNIADARWLATKFTNPRGAACR